MIQHVLDYLSMEALDVAVGLNIASVIDVRCGQESAHCEDGRTHFGRLAIECDRRDVEALLAPQSSLVDARLMAWQAVMSSANPSGIGLLAA